ncbi:EF-Tu/IF-2/RF-3 family GTPase [Microbacterium maritypicum]
MGWLFGRKREPQDANEALRRYNEAEAARLAAMTSGAPTVAAGESFTAVTSSTEFPVEDVFTITGRGIVVTGTVTSGVLRMGDAVVVTRGGATTGSTEITGIEMFRKTVREAAPGANVGLLLRGTVDVVRGDVIRPAASA